MDFSKLLSFLRLNTPPTKRQTVATVLGQPAAISHSLSVDRIHGILRSAEAGECQDYFSLCRDILLGHAHTQTVYNQRKLACLTKALTISPADPKSADDLAAAEACKLLTKSKGWLTTAMSHLLNGHLYPLAILEQVYGVNRDPRFPQVRVAPIEWAPVPYHLLDWTDGHLQLWEADAKHGHRLGSRAAPAAPQYIVHRGHLLTSLPDNWGGPMRAALFWYLFAVMDRDWWVRFLDRFGAPFIVGKYESSDDASRTLLTRAFSAATRLFGLVVSKETDITVHSVATASHGEAFEKMQVFANGELSKLVLGQTMTTTAQAAGLGGGAQATVQENVRGDIEAWDITALAETVNNSIIRPFLRFNAIPGEAELSIATSTGADMDRQSAFLTAAAQAGLEPTDDGVEILGRSSGIPLQRIARPVAPGLGLTALTAAAPARSAEATLRRLGQPTNDELDQIATAGASRLAAAFTGRYAPVRRLIDEADSLDALMAGLAKFSATLTPGAASRLTEDALSAYAATAAATSPR